MNFKNFDFIMQYKKLNVLWKISIGLILGAIFVFFNVSSNPSKKIEEAAVNIIRDRLNDPESAKFLNVVYRPELGVCGEFNAKNKFGGYVGYKKFLVETPGMTLIEGPDLQEYQRDLLRNCKI